MGDILELSALTPDRPKARLRTHDDPDGTVYELAVPEDFGAVAMATLGRHFSKLDELWTSEEKLTEAQERELEGLLNTVAAALVPDAPAAAIAQLPAITKRTIGIRFFVRTGELGLEQMGIPAAGQSISAGSPPASRPSTEETPQPG